MESHEEFRLTTQLVRHLVTFFERHGYLAEEASDTLAAAVGWFLTEHVSPDEIEKRVPKLAEAIRVNYEAATRLTSGRSG